jgi:hypothetical protein
MEIEKKNNLQMEGMKEASTSSSSNSIKLLVKSKAKGMLAFFKKS